MQGSSLALRLFVLAAIWSALSLAAAGSVLIAVYRGSAERAFDERLGVYLKTLVGAIAAQSDTAGSFREPDNVGEPRFELPLSGWYWVVRRSGDNKVVVASKSLVGDVLVLPSDVGIVPGTDRTAKGYIRGPDGQDLRIIEREISFDEQNAFRLAVAGNAGDLNEDITVFSTRTALILALVGFGLVITTYFQVRLGLFPIERMRRALTERKLDVLIHNAGLLHREGLGTLREHVADIRAQFETNTLAPLLLTEALLPNLRSGSKVVFVTSRMGSVADNSSGGYYGYRMSKGALNVAGKSLSIDLRERGVAVALLHPGFVRTGMTGGAGDIDPATAAAQLIERIDALNLSNSGQFWHAKGEVLPW